MFIAKSTGFPILRQTHFDDHKWFSRSPHFWKHRQEAGRHSRTEREVQGGSEVSVGSKMSSLFAPKETSPIAVTGRVVLEITFSRSKADANRWFRSALLVVAGGLSHVNPQRSALSSPVSWVPLRRPYLGPQEAKMPLMPSTQVWSWTIKCN